MKWIKRNCVDQFGYPVTSVTDETPLDVFLRFQKLVDANRVEFEAIAVEWKNFRATGKFNGKAPNWSVRKEKLLNRLAKEAGLKDT